MAFQCEGCYKDKSAFMWALLSKGPCENCHYTDICIDAPFNTDPKWRQNLVAALKKANLPIPDKFKKYDTETN